MLKNHAFDNALFIVPVLDDSYSHRKSWNARKIVAVDDDFYKLWRAVFCGRVNDDKVASSNFREKSPNRIKNKPLIVMFVLYSC